MIEATQALRCVSLCFRREKGVSWLNLQESGREHRKDTEFLLRGELQPHDCWDGEQQQREVCSDPNAACRNRDGEVLGLLRAQHPDLPGDAWSRDLEYEKVDGDRYVGAAGDGRSNIDTDSQPAHRPKYLIVHHVESQLDATERRTQEAGVEEVSLFIKSALGSSSFGPK